MPPVSIALNAWIGVFGWLNAKKVRADPPEWISPLDLGTAPVYVYV